MLGTTVPLVLLALPLLGGLGLLLLLLGLLLLGSSRRPRRRLPLTPDR